MKISLMAAYPTLQLKKIYVVILSLLCCLFTTSSVLAQQDEALVARKASLEQRVLAKWDALIKGDFETAYKFTSPAYRELHSLGFFQSRFGGKVAWTKVEVIDIRFDSEEAANVTIRIHFDFFQKETGRTLKMSNESQESWIHSDDEWWYSVPS